MKTQNFVDYSKHNLSNPNFPFVNRKYGTFGFILLGSGLSLTVAPLFGCISMGVSLIKMVWFNAQLNLLLSRQAKIKNDYEELKKNINESKGKQKINNATKKKAKLFLKEINQNKVKIENIKFYRYEKIIIFTASFFALIPGIGTFIAGFFLKRNLANIKENGLRGVFEAISQILFSPCQKIIHKRFFPLSQMNFKTFYSTFRNTSLEKALLDKETSLQHMQAKEISISINRGDRCTKLPIIIAPAKDRSFNYSEPLMVIFPGNMCIAHELGNYVKFYQNCGMHVIIVPMAGYPGTNDNETLTNEISSCQDVYSTLTFLKKRGAKKIGVHGTSMGGTRAMMAAEMFPKLVRLVVANQTFDHIKNVAANCFNNNKSFLPSSFIRGLVGATYISGETVPGVFTYDGNFYKTDGFDNERKAALLRKRENEGISVCDIYAIRSSNDRLMGRVQKSHSVFKEDFAESLVLARYDKKKNIIEIPGNHVTWFDNIDNPANGNGKELHRLLFNIFLRSLGKVITFS